MKCVSPSGGARLSGKRDPGRKVIGGKSSFAFWPVIRLPEVAPTAWWSSVVAELSELSGGGNKWWRLVVGGVKCVAHWRKVTGGVES